MATDLLLFTSRYYIIKQVNSINYFIFCKLNKQNPFQAFTSFLIWTITTQSTRRIVTRCKSCQGHVKSFAKVSGKRATIKRFATTLLPSGDTECPKDVLKMKFLTYLKVCLQMHCRQYAQCQKYRFAAPMKTTFLN